MDGQHRQKSVSNLENQGLLMACASQARASGLATLLWMSSSPPSPRAPESLVSYFCSRGDALRSRSVSEIVLSTVLDVPVPPAQLSADWHRDMALHLALEAGDVEELSLARARRRWPDYRRCMQAAFDWTRSLGLGEMLATCDVALMACRGARYHHDGAHYGAFAFCNLFLSEDKGLDLHFPSTGHRIPLTRGTAVIFDTSQPHGVIARASSRFEAADFSPDQDLSQVFLTWELPIEDVHVGHALGIDFDIDSSTALLLEDEQVWFHGAPASVSPDSGRWYRAG